MRRDRIFLRFDGILSEDMEFEPRRGWETNRIARRPPEGDGEFLLELLDKHGETLIRVSPRVDFDAESGMTPENETMKATRVTSYVPYHPSARLLVFRRDTYTIYETPITKTPPQVQVGEASIKGHSVSLNWEAVHRSKNPLTYNIVCVVDEGKRYVMLARDLEESEAELSLNNVPGGEGRLGVLATDGVRSSFAVTKPFKVETKPPNISISWPIDGSTVPPDQPVTLTGRAADVTGKTLPEDGLVWDVDGTIARTGNGTALAASLRPGQHEATLSLQENGNVVADKTVTFTVNDYNDAQLRHRDVMGFDQPGTDVG